MNRRYDTITPTGPPCHREPSIIIVLMSMSNNKLAFTATMRRIESRIDGDAVQLRRNISKGGFTRRAKAGDNNQQTADEVKTAMPRPFTRTR